MNTSRACSPTSPGGCPAPTTWSACTTTWSTPATPSGAGERAGGAGAGRPPHDRGCRRRGPLVLPAGPLLVAVGPAPAPALHDSRQPRGPPGGLGFEIRSVERGPATMGGELFNAIGLVLQHAVRSPHLPWLGVPSLAHRVARGAVRRHGAGWSPRSPTRPRTPASARTGWATPTGSWPAGPDVPAVHLPYVDSALAHMDQEVRRLLAQPPLGPLRRPGGGGRQPGGVRGRRRRPDRARRGDGRGGRRPAGARRRLRLRRHPRPHPVPSPRLPAAGPSTSASCAGPGAWPARRAGAVRGRRRVRCRCAPARRTTCWRWSACSTSPAARRSSGRRPGCWRRADPGARRLPAGARGMATFLAKAAELGPGDWYGHSSTPLTSAGYERLGRGPGSTCWSTRTSPRTLPTYPARRRLCAAAGADEVATIDRVEALATGGAWEYHVPGLPAAGFVSGAASCSWCRPWPGINPTLPVGRELAARGRTSPGPARPRWRGDAARRPLHPGACRPRSATTSQPRPTTCERGRPQAPRGRVPGAAGRLHGARGARRRRRPGPTLSWSTSRPWRWPWPWPVTCRGPPPPPPRRCSPTRWR